MVFKLLETLSTVIVGGLVLLFLLFIVLAITIEVISFIFRLSWWVPVIIIGLMIFFILYDIKTVNKGGW